MKTGPKLELEHTGSPEFDRILGGGIPRQSVVVVAGEPGSGKTVMTLQMLFHAAREGRKCLYLTTLSEPAVKLIRHMRMFDFFDEALMEKYIVLRDIGREVRSGPQKTLDLLSALVEELEPALVVIDSFRVIGQLMQGAAESRTFVYELAVQMAGWGATTLLLGEYTREDMATYPEFSVADGIIRLGTERQELTSVRELEVLKMRGVGYSSGRHFFDISAAGLTVYPRVSAPSDVRNQTSPETSERDATGVAGLDDLLGGGLPTGSTTVLQGGTGSGKTLLSLEFLMQGARLGQKGVLFTQEETPDQLRAIARSLGWDLAALEKSGLLVIRYTSPVELSTDRYLHEARREVEQLGARRAVFDSLTTLALGVTSERRFKEMVYAIAKHLKGVRTTLLMTMEAEQLLGSATVSGQGVSFIADNLIQLRYVELQGRLERAISVLKARGIQHESELRSLLIEKGGLKVVSGRFKDMRGVLTGLPSYAPEGER